MSAHASSSSRRDRQSLHFIVRSGLAGGFAGCVAKTVVAPLDRVKILFQASNPEFHKYAGTWSGAFRAGAQIYRDSGVLGLFQGHSATLLRIFPYAAIKFMAYDQIEHILMPTPEKQTNVRRFVAGALSGVTSVLFTYPLELIRVRMAFDTRNGSGPRPTFLHAAYKIYHEAPVPVSPSSTSTVSSKSTLASSSTSSTVSPTTSTTSKALFTRFPILKFYRGFSVSLAGMIPYAGTSFLAWGYLRSYFIPPRPTSSSSSTSSLEPQRATPLQDLTFGALSGLLAQTASYPFEVVRRRMQVGGLTHPDRWLRWGETVRMIWTTRGFKGFYVGLSIGYLKVVPMTAVSFMVWQWGKRVLGV
ncbi:mitochondrial carrier [Panus rudis PR-1116 ss-1]|nr:mitochondrial carrier [Panus rudis PR-1116 ss-1]